MSFLKVFFICYFLYTQLIIHCTLFDFFQCDFLTYVVFYLITASLVFESWLSIMQHPFAITSCCIFASYMNFMRSFDTGWLQANQVSLPHATISNVTLTFVAVCLNCVLALSRARQSHDLGCGDCQVCVLMQSKQYITITLLAIIMAWSPYCPCAVICFLQGFIPKMC